MTFVALITGASSGIGEATARRLAERDGIQLVLVARREERLQALARELGGDPTIIAIDLTDPEAPARIAETIQREHGALHLLVNNAGARWSEEFADGGYENIERNMRINFEAPVRLVEALLPLLRRTAGTFPGATGQRASGPAETVSIVNVSSTSGRVARRGTGGYAAAKAALAVWNDSLALEEAAHGVHVGLVLPGFIVTEGFPQAELRGRPLTRWLVGDPEVVVDAILEAGPGGRAERYAPGYYWLFAALRTLAPGLIRRAMSRGTFTTATKAN
ncbi:MAG TPA: SDR family NAD(P)-dependent oxidoreductase [Solirubrobacteraceae bacterium]|nr:SDR family NAD(P)-dependent oxidoreductase [Solirubrobacteraceae bacterium]